MRPLAALLLALALACEPPPNDEAAPADGGVAVIQQAATCGGPHQPPCLSTGPLTTHISWHFRYHPLADDDIAQWPTWDRKGMPRVLPQTGGYQNTWFGSQPSITNISPPNGFRYILLNCPPTGNCVHMETGTGNVTEIRTDVAGPQVRQGISSITMAATSGTYQVFAGTVWLTIGVLCKQTGQPGSGEEINTFFYPINIAQRDLYINLESGSPYYDSQYWGRVAKACGQGPAVENHGFQSWHHEFWVWVGFPPQYSLVYDPAFNWY